MVLFLCGLGLLVQTKNQSHDIMVTLQYEFILCGIPQFISGWGPLPFPPFLTLSILAVTLNHQLSSGVKIILQK